LRFGSAGPPVGLRTPPSKPDPGTISTAGPEVDEKCQAPFIHFAIMRGVKSIRRVVALALVVLPCRAQAPAAVSDAELAAALARAGDRAAELRGALARAPAEQRAALEFLIAHMPIRDLRSLGADFLLEDLGLAHQAWRAAPWADLVSEDLFRDAILPYAQVSETREPWRARLRALCLPMVEGCTSPGEAAQRINRQLFAKLGVKYSTQRRRADQSPSESIEQGLASCTGLSILLADACRAVGVPARLAGIASWPHKRGNHTWVEVWDGERWRFTGAAEHDPAGLDRAWFTADAAAATSADPRHAVWAVRWQKTGSRFPLVWAPDSEVHAVDVTARYARPAAPEAGTMRLWIDVREAGGRRVAARVELRDADGAVRSGTAKGEGADTNDHLEFAVPRGSSWTVRADLDGRAVETAATLAGAPQQLLVLELPPPAAGEAELREAALRYFTAAGDARAEVRFPAAADELVGRDEARARALVWDAYRTAPIHAAARADFDARIVRTVDREARYTVRQVGERPAGGFGLVIAMHGGGGVPAPVNDQQWGVMQRYYRDRPEAGGYLYLALRAPNDSWNGFYDDAICPLVEELIRQFTLFGAVDPDRVVAIGYSHGGYGAFVIGPKIPDRFAAVHASAAAPTPGETLAENLRNLRFSFMVGSRDTAYGRIERCDEFAGTLAALRAADPAGYPFVHARVEGQGHGGLPDRDQLAALLPLRRDPAPRALVWRPSDGRLRDHFWLSIAEPADGQLVRAQIDGATVKVATEAVGALTLWLDRRLLGSASEVRVERDGTALELACAPRAAVLCESLARRADPGLAAVLRVDLPAPR
jgi:hypothetical protein